MSNHNFFDNSIISDNDVEEHKIKNTLIVFPKDKKSTNKKLNYYKDNIDNSIIHHDENKDININFYNKIMASKIPVNKKNNIKTKDDNITEDNDSIKGIKKLIIEYINQLEILNNHLTDISKNKCSVEKYRSSDGAYINSTFISSLNHHMKTSLNCFIISVQLLDDILKDEHHRKILNHLLASCVDMSKYLNSITDYYMLTQGKVNINPVKCDIRKDIMNVLGMHELTLKKKQIKTDLDIDDKSKLILIDWKKISTIIYKIIQNSINNTENGNIKLVCKLYDNLDNLIISSELLNSKIIEKVKNSDDVGILYICISDNGVKISIDDCEKIFEPFFQINNDEAIVTERNGLGLGLTICKGFIELMHGYIRAIPNEKKGLKIELSIPVSVCETKNIT